jgi:hypothetical protein
MTRVLMSVLLLTFTVSSGFVSNGYQKVYGQEAVRLTLDGFSGQTRSSVTVAGLINCMETGEVGPVFVVGFSLLLSSLSLFKKGS